MRRSILKSLAYLILPLHLCLISCHMNKETNVAPVRRASNVNSAVEEISSTGSELEWKNISQIRNSEFVNGKEAWFVTAMKGELLHTVNGGSTWERVLASQNPGFEVAYFIDAQRGWAVSKQAKVLYTLDGGHSWIEIAALRVPNEAADFLSAYDMVFADERHGWIVETFSIWYTEDGGYSWAKGLSSSDPDAGKGLESIFFINSQTGWACGKKGKLYSTNDGGVTWHPRIAGRGIDFDNVFFINKNTGWLKGGNTIYRTIDEGKTWLRYSIADESTVIWSSTFISESEGWATGYKQQGGDTAPKAGRGIVLHTSDSGRTWILVQVGESEPFFSRIYFIGEYQGWLLSRDNVYRTEDGGKTWHTVLQLPPIENSSD